MSFNHEETYIGSKIFDKIKTDERVTPDLDHCLYCLIKDTESGELREFKIKLDCINGKSFKQCPACKRIYILKDILD